MDTRGPRKRTNRADATSIALPEAAAAFRDGLLHIRDLIDPHAWPIVDPRFRPAEDTARRRVAKPLRGP